MNAFKDDWQAIYEQNIKHIDPALKKKVEKLKDILTRYKKKMTKYSRMDAAKPQLWNLMWGETEKVLTPDDTVQFPEIDGILDYIAEEAEGWVSYIHGNGTPTVEVPEGWYVMRDPVDYDAQFETINNIIADIDSFLDGSYYR